MKLPFEERKLKVITLKELETDKKYGKNPEDRTMKELLEQGVLCLNKPAGPTSHLATEYLKNVLKVKKAGHGGTLDPQVTGVLPIALNQASRTTNYLLLAGKEYVAIMLLHQDITKKEVEKAFEKFKGKIRQKPPIRSAVKRVERTREVYYLEIMEKKGREVLFKMGCQAGTYVRKIIHDLGESMGIGAHMDQLVRTKAGPFNDREMYNLQDIKDAYTEYQKGKEKKLRQIIKPIEHAVQHLPKIWIADGAVSNICHGADLNVPGISKMQDPIKAGETVAIYTLKDELVGVGELTKSSDSIWKSRRNKAVRVNKIFMPRQLYPKFQ
jgi:H/ACA ribonucleoprotein complex subunit 4